MRAAIAFPVLLGAVALGLLSAAPALAVAVAVVAFGATVAAISTEPFIGLVAALLGGTFIAGVAAFRKAGPEAEAIGIASLRGVIEELRSELERKDKQIADLNERCGKLLGRVEKLEGLLEAR